jgi:membrane protein required for colicin V production
MNLIDFLILIPIAYFCYRGFVNGIIKEVLSIVGIILGVFLTFQYMDPVGTAIAPFFDQKSSFIPFVSAVIIFVGTLAVVNLVAYLSKKFLETIQLNFVNRLAGSVFGFLKSGIVVSAILLILAGFGIPSQQSRQESATYSYIIYLAPWAYDAVATVYPGAEDFSSTIQKTLKQYNPVKNFPLVEKEE